jgi:RHS repeat-associated protein
MMWQVRYTPFGSSRLSASSLPTNRRFNGMKEESALGGIYDFNARFYDPVIGRFLSADTVVSGAWNPQKHMDADRHPRTILIRRRRCAREEGGRQHDNDLCRRTLREE